MKILFNWHHLEEIYPDPTKTVILKTVLEGPPLDTLYRIGTIFFDQYSQYLVFSGSMIDTIDLALSHKTDMLLNHQVLKKYVWDYYITEWEELDIATNIIELLDIS